MKKYIFFLPLVLIWSCTIIAPTLDITGEKTAFENQVLGSYTKLEQDLEIYSSQRTVGAKKQSGVSAQQASVYMAMQNQAYNRDDLHEVMRNQLAGEDSRGFVELLPKYERADSLVRAKVGMLVEQENKNREVIYQRLIKINALNQQYQDSTVYNIFAEKNRENAVSGTMMQMPDGTWVEKKK